MLKKIASATLLAASLAAGTLALSTPASAGEGHWSIGHGVQCKVVLGVVVCGKTRP
jgi:hypothetical protein